MSCMTLKVELLAGTDIELAIKEAKIKCEKLDLAYIEFNFNGINVHVQSTTDIDVLLEKYKNAGKYDFII